MTVLLLSLKLAAMQALTVMKGYALIAIRQVSCMERKIRAIRFLNWSAYMGKKVMTYAWHTLFANMPFATPAVQDFMFLNLSLLTIQFAFINAVACKKFEMICSVSRIVKNREALPVFYFPEKNFFRVQYFGLLMSITYKDKKALSEKMIKI